MYSVYDFRVWGLVSERHNPNDSTRILQAFEGKFPHDDVTIDSDGSLIVKGLNPSDMHNSPYNLQNRVQAVVDALVDAGMTDMPEDKVLLDYNHDMNRQTRHVINAS